MYVFSLGVFSIVVIHLVTELSMSVFNLLNVTPCFVSIYRHTISTVKND